MVKPTKVTNSIRELRFAAGEMTQAELADRVGVTRQTIIAIEQERYSPSLEVAFKIAQALGRPLASGRCARRSRRPTPGAARSPMMRARWPPRGRRSTSSPAIWPTAS